MNFLDQLDENQRRAAEAPPTPLKVIAGAGAGKTRTLVARIANQLNTGVVTPDQMFISAFTRAAADEMKERIELLVSAPDSYVGTFHSLMFRLLNDERRAASREPYDICKESYRTGLIRDLLGKSSKNFPEALGVDGADVAGVGSRISLWKNNIIHCNDIEVVETLSSAEPQTDMWCAAAVYPLYQARLAKENLVDFDDMLLLAHDLLKSDAGVLMRAQAKWSAFFTDEVQDSNVIQWAIMRMLAPPSSDPNFTVVGDPRQALFRFRSATPELMNDFQKVYPSATVVNLSVNYRSTSEIVDHANRLVAEFSLKAQSSHAGSGRAPSYVTFKNPFEQANEIAQYITDYRDNGHEGGEVAVLVRTNAQSADIESAFVSQKLPYWCNGGGFFDRLEIGDVMAYLRLAADHTDARSLHRIINKPTRYLGRVYVETVESNASSTGGDLVKAIRATTRYSGKKLFPKQLAASVDLANLLDFIDPNMSASTAIDVVLDNTDYLDWLKTTSGTHPSADDSRKENLEALKEVATRQGSVTALIDFANQATKLQSQSSDATEILTVHRAKGREWPVVFVTNFYDGSMPHSHAREGGIHAIPDELRIAYVGFTRAQERLFVCSPTADNFGKEAAPSQFFQLLQEWPEPATAGEEWWNLI